MIHMLRKHFLFIGRKSHSCRNCLSSARRVEFLQKTFESKATQSVVVRCHTVVRRTLCRGNQTTTSTNTHLFARLMPACVGFSTQVKENCLFQSGKL